MKKALISIKADEFTLVQSDPIVCNKTIAALTNHRNVLKKNMKMRRKLSILMQNNAFYEQVKKWSDEYGIKVTVNDEVFRTK